MTTTTLRKAVNLFISCQNLIQLPKSICYNDLKPLLRSYLSKAQFERAVEAWYSEERLLGQEAIRSPRVLLIEIRVQAEHLQPQLRPREKLEFILSLLNLIRNNNEELNRHLNTALYGIAEIFSYTYEQTASMQRLMSQKEPLELDYSDSVLLTNEPPDYVGVINGLKVIYDPEFTFKMWIKNVSTINHLLLKVVELKKAPAGLSIKTGELLNYTCEVERFLGSHGITLTTLSQRLVSNCQDSQRIEIARTERSPLVVINPAESRIEIQGISMVNEREGFYSPVFHWLDKVITAPPKKFNLHINLASFNAYSSRVILKLLQKVALLESLSCKTKIYWHHEEGDPDMKSVGEYYASMVNKEFMYITYADHEFITV